LALAERRTHEHSSVQNIGIPDTLRRLVDAVEPAWVWDPAHDNAVWANKSGLAFWQVADRASLKRKVFSPQHPLCMAARHASECLTKRAHVSLSVVLDAADTANMVRWCSFTLHPLPDGRSGLLVRVQDAPQQSSPESESKPVHNMPLNAGADYMQSANASIIHTAENGTILYCNHTAADVFGLREGDLLFEKLGVALQTQEANGVATPQHLTTELGALPALVTRHPHADTHHGDKTSFWVIDELPAVVNAPDAAEEALELVLRPYPTEDATGNAAQAAALSALDTTGVAVFLLEADGRIGSASTYALQWLGGDADTIIDQPLTKFLDAASAEKITPLLQNGVASADNTFAMGAGVQICLDGQEPRAASLTLRPHNNGAPSQFWAFLYNSGTPATTASADTQLWQNNAAVLSHEVKSPLNAILGYTQLLKSTLAEQPHLQHCTDWLNNIQEAGEHIDALTTDILEINKLTSGQVDIQAAPVDIAEVVQAAVRLMMPQTRAAHVNIDAQIIASCPNVLTDRTGLQQIMLNLIGNAIKASPRGGTVHITAGATKSGRVMLEVADEGEGMTPEQISLALQPFGRVGKVSLDRRGTGLGLPIVRRLAELLGVRFALDSNPDAHRTRARIIFAESAVLTAQ
jgi:nitrogen-specific signal transduction histidine kinase/PAS domain-containing protein